ncbi:MAG: hypothetical protein EOO96_23270 [Pedobacter sp.]|nr:MAG: hypothetical protein EOO96_23270 [Pedobacter sp.]
MVTALLIFSLCNVNAQKANTNTGVVVNPNKAVSRALPDLTFHLVPVLVGSGNGVEKLDDTSGRLKIPINFIVKNIGFTTSKPTTVYAEYGYLSSQNVIYIKSDPMLLQSLEPGKEVLLKHQFIFKPTPEQAYNKALKLRLVIAVSGANNKNELLVNNNTSDELSITINR